MPAVRGHNQFAATYELIDAPRTARADRLLLLRVRLHNTGDSPWPHRGATTVNLGYHWLAADGSIVDFNGLRVGLPNTVAPGEWVEVELQVEPPAPGDYLLAIDLVEENVAWFSQQGVDWLTTPITITPAAEDALRVCIIGQVCLIRDAVGNHMVDQARALQAQGYHVDILLEHVDPRQPADVREIMASISYEALRSSLGKPASNPHLRRAIENFRKADVFIFHYAVHYELFEAIQFIHHGVILVDYHGITPAHLWNSTDREYERLRASQAQLQLLRYADYAIAHSAYTRDELIATNTLAPERIIQMALPVDLRRFHPKQPSQALLKQYGIGQKRPLLLYVGRIAANKRIGDLVRALPLIRAQFPDTMLLLVGDTRPADYALEAEQAKALAAQLGVAEAVIFTGSVSDADLAQLYNLADLFVTASLHEGFCIPVIEAMASGVPVVGTRTTALPETIGDGGLTFTPQDPADLARQVLTILSSRTTEQPKEHRI
jgi:glycosyltransferase involved in cell wall biosynthesis